MDYFYLISTDTATVVLRRDFAKSSYIMLTDFVCDFEYGNYLFIHILAQNILNVHAREEKSADSITFKFIVQTHK